MLRRVVFTALTTDAGGSFCTHLQDALMHHMHHMVLCCMDRCTTPCAILYYTLHDIAHAHHPRQECFSACADHVQGAAEL